MRIETLQFTVALGANFLRQICTGVAHLHRNHIIHRDLATRNVLLRINFNDPNAVPECVLVDMGLSRLYDRESNYLKTKTATLPLKWCAPELLRDQKFSGKKLWKIQEVWVLMDFFFWE